MLFLKNNISISLAHFGLVKLFVIFFISMHYSYAQQNICVGSITNYKVDELENGGNGTIGSTYQWMVVNPLFQGIINFTSPPNTNAITINWLNTPPGIYTLKVVETDTGACNSVQNMQISIFNIPQIDLSDQIVCVHPSTGQFINPVLLQSGLSNTQYSFQWFHNGVLISNNSNLVVTTLGNYSIIATHLISGCTTTSSALISISSAPMASVSVDNPFNDTQLIQVTINSGFGEYEYALNNGSFQDAPYFTVQEPGIYQVTVRDKNFCGETTLTAHVINYPKFFTPNNDGYNDFWNIIGLPPNYNAKVSIFDRYGKLLYQFNPKYSNWNGQYNNTSVPSTDYWFTIDYSDEINRKFSFKSHFSLIR